MSTGKYLNLSPRPLTQHDWLTLWTLLNETEWAQT